MFLSCETSLGVVIMMKKCVGLVLDRFFSRS